MSVGRTSIVFGTSMSPHCPFTIVTVRTLDGPRLSFTIVSPLTGTCQGSVRPTTGGPRRQDSGVGVNGRRGPSPFTCTLSTLTGRRTDTSTGVPRALSSASGSSVTRRSCFLFGRTFLCFTVQFDPTLGIGVTGGVPTGSFRLLRSGGPHRFSFRFRKLGSCPRALSKSGSEERSPVKSTDLHQYNLNLSRLPINLIIHELRGATLFFLTLRRTNTVPYTYGFFSRNHGSLLSPTIPLGRCL